MEQALRLLGVAVALMAAATSAATEASPASLFATSMLGATARSAIGAKSRNGS